MSPSFLVNRRNVSLLYSIGTLCPVGRLRLTLCFDYVCMFCCVGTNLNISAKHFWSFLKSRISGHSLVSGRCELGRRCPDTRGYTVFDISINRAIVCTVDN